MNPFFEISPMCIGAIIGAVIGIKLSEYFDRR